MKTLTTLSLITMITLFVGCSGGSGSSSDSSSDSSSGGSGSSSDSSGGSGSSSGGGSSSEQPSQQSSKFLSFYTPSDDSETKSIQLFSRNADNTLTSEVVDSTLYPPQVYGGGYDFIRNADAYGNLYVMTLNKDFNTSKYTEGVIGYLDSKTYEYLPLIEPKKTSRYKSYHGGTGKVTPNGYVLYMGTNGDIGYSDADVSYLMRYNTQTKASDTAISCKGFILDQPEKGSDTEDCVVGTNFSPSVDGRYIFGDMSGYGVDGGALHWDYKILFQYDFENQKYTRLGEEGDSHVGFIGTTSNGKNIVYRSGENLNTKVLNIETGTIKNLKNVNVYGISSQRPSQWNENGIVTSSNVNLSYIDIVNDKETVVVPKGAYNGQFSEDGKSIYFRLRDDSERIVYKTKDLSENSPYEKVGVVPEGYGDLLLVRGNPSTSSNSSNVSDDGNSTSSSSPKSCLEDEGMDGEVYWTTCYNLFPQSECSNSGLGQESDPDYTDSYKVVDGGCLENGFTSDDYPADEEYQGQTYRTYTIFP